MTTATLPVLPTNSRRSPRGASPGVPTVAGFGENARKLSWLRNFLEMCEAGDGIVGSTPKSLALRADLKRQIAALESSQNPQLGRAERRP